MYNMQFGDCFQIERHSNNEGLVVDFGSLNSISYEKYDRIITHFNTTEPTNLLLTHFHLDHISGLLFMMHKGKNRHNFKKVFLPDIFTGTNSEYLLTTVFLEDFLNRCLLPQKYKACTLLELLKFLCGNKYIVKFLKRGDCFENYRVLWPDMSHALPEAMRLIDDLRENDSTRRIVEYAMRLALYASETTDRLADEGIERSSDFINDSFERLNSFENELTTKLKEDSNAFISMEIIKLRLARLNHSINIVFHNKIACGNNILFTGDVESPDMQNIASNFDANPVLNLYEKYGAIKVPHHGTEAHYFDYKCYSPNYLLLPNGKCRSDSYKISEKYSLSQINDYGHIHPAMRCSNNNWCKRREDNGFCCSNSKVAYLNDYLKIQLY